MLLSKAKGAIIVKKRKIITVGKPNLTALSKTEAKIFYSTLLFAVIDYYWDGEKPSDKSKMFELKPQKSKATYTMK